MCGALVSQQIYLIFDCTLQRLDLKVCPTVVNNLIGYPPILTRTGWDRRVNTLLNFEKHHDTYTSMALQYMEFSRGSFAHMIKQNKSEFSNDMLVVSEVLFYFNKC